MRALAPLLLLTACAAEPDAPADTDPAADDTDPVDTVPADTDPDDTVPDDTVPDEPPGDPCYAAPTSVQLGDIDGELFRPFTPGMTLRLGFGIQIPGGAWHVEWAGVVSNAPQLLRVTSSITDVETGLVLSNNREPTRINTTAVPPVLGQPWSCVGAIAETNHQLDPRGMDDDASVPVWNEVCGRTVRLDVTLRDIDDVELAAVNAEFVLAPFVDHADTCP